MNAWKLTDPFHKAPYAAISPSLPQLSQSGKTILVTGGNAGIGLAMAKAFSQASAARVIILGRSAQRTTDAAARLAQECPGTHVEGRVCDVASPDAVDELWGTLKREGLVVDVLVLNAVKISSQKPILEAGVVDIWGDFDMNVRAQLQMAERFYKQEEGVSGPKYLVNVSTFAIHDWKVAGNTPGYGLTKSAAALAMQLIAQDVSPDTLQIVNMNPGGVYTQNAKDAGFTEDSYAWNDADLPGQFAVWLASPEASFLHGRFVWAEWDVDELKGGELRKKIDEDEFFLKVGVCGL